MSKGNTIFLDKIRLEVVRFVEQVLSNHEKKNTDALICSMKMLNGVIVIANLEKAKGATNIEEIVR